MWAKVGCIVTLTLLCITLAATEGVNTFTKEYKNHTGPGQVFTVSVENILYYFTVKNTSITISAINAQYKQCKLSINSPIHIDRRSIPVLNNGKVILTDIELKQFYIIEPPVCMIDVSFNMETKIRLDIEESVIFRTLVTHENTFDVFDRKLKRCFPCRFDTNGTWIQPLESLDPKAVKLDPRGDDQYLFFISTIQNFSDLDEGYVMLNTDLRSSVTSLKLLDSEFRLLKERKTNNGTLVYSTTYGSISVCFFMCAESESSDCQTLICEILDSDLNSKLTIRLFDFSKSFDGKNFSSNYRLTPRINNLPDGGAMVLMDLDFFNDIPEDLHEDSNKTANFEPTVSPIIEPVTTKPVMKLPEGIYIQRLHPDGQVDSPIRFNNLSNGNMHLQSFVLDNGTYCLSGVQYRKDGAGIITKCLETR